MAISIRDNFLSEKEADLVNLKIEFEKELNSILDFWSSETIDLDNEGFIGEIDFFGVKNTSSSKGCILNTRILWTFSSAYRRSKNKQYKKVADRAFQYLKSHFLDPIFGGLYWEVDSLGIPLNKRKQAYAQGFGIYAFSEYFRATNNDESLSIAIDLFRILEDKFKDSKYSGYLEAFSEDWGEIADMRLSEKDLNAPKSMNTHLHILEPYTNLYRVWPNEELKESISDLTDIFCNQIFDGETNHLNLFFDYNWDVMSSEVSFGHDIEAAWLINEASKTIHKGVLNKRIKLMTLSLIDYTLKEGLDKDGSLYNCRKGNNIDRDKHWWSQAEAMVGLFDAYEESGDFTYVEHLIKIWDFIKSNLISKEGGAWIWRVNDMGVPYKSDVKVGFWKCPYHNGRALMELIERIEKLEKNE